MLYFIAKKIRVLSRFIKLKSAFDITFIKFSDIFYMPLFMQDIMNKD